MFKRLRSEEKTDEFNSSRADAVQGKWDIEGTFLRQKT